MDLKDEKKYASENYEKLVSQLPEKLIKLEGKALDRISKSKKNTLNKLDSLYLKMGKVEGYIQRFTPCKKGCSACCHYPVTVSEIEIKYIERNTKFRKAKRKNNDFKKTNGKPCVFLINNSCSIYHARPYACRRHAVLTKTAYWCDPIRSGDEKFPLLMFSGFDAAFDYVRRESNSYNLVDIREAFYSVTSQ